MRTYTLASFVLAISLATARNCQNITIPVSIQARNGQFNVTASQNNIDVTNFILNGGQQGHNFTAETLTGYATISDTYNISASYCTPESGPGQAIQILTHGIGFDRSYWDFSYNNYNYSYVNAALAANYSTLAYDRLGVGQSSRADPIQVIQSFLEIAALAELTRLVRTGNIIDSYAYIDVVHIGHSFGSFLTYGLVQQYPNISNGAILTGFSQDGEFLGYFDFGGNFIAVQSSPFNISYPAGYIAAGDETGVQTIFFAPGDFDPAILSAAYKTGQPFTEGELLTIGAAASGVNNFGGPVLIITGDRDVPFCGGDCHISDNASLPNIPSSSKENFPNASAFDVVIVPGAGHGLNLQYSHPYTYSAMLEFLGANKGSTASPRGSVRRSSRITGRSA